jgi:hypothetical protein
VGNKVDSGDRKRFFFCCVVVSMLVFGGGCVVAVLVGWDGLVALLLTRQEVVWGVLLHPSLRRKFRVSNRKPGSCVITRIG